MVNATSMQGISALVLTRRNARRLRHGTVLPLFDRVLVFDDRSFQHVAAAGGQPVRMATRFSYTDPRGVRRALLGPVLSAWRWRRILLNENVEHVVLPPRSLVIVVRIGARLARARLHGLSLIDRPRPVSDKSSLNRKGIA